MATIDYITASLPYSEDYFLKMPHDPSFNLATQTYPPKRYETAWYLASGALVAVPSKKNARQRILFQMSGDACQMSRALEVEDTKLLHWLMVESRAKFSRLDVAFDTVDPTAWPERLLWEWRWKQVKTHIREEPRSWQKEGGGVTYYFGAETSPRQLRVYDKAAELELLAGLITRIELQNRDDLAQHLVGQVIKLNNLDWVAARAVKDFVDFPQVKWYQETLKSGGLTLDKLGRKKSDFQKWWREDIEKTFQNHYRDNENGDRMFLRQSLERMREIMKKYDENGH